LLDGLSDVDANGLTVDTQDEISCAYTRPGGRRVFERSLNFDEAVLGRDFDTDPRIVTCGAPAYVFELATIEVRGMCIEPGEHSAYGAVDQLVVGNLIDVLAPHLSQDFGQPTRVICGELLR
jgi:hypothetical protein